MPEYSQTPLIKKLGIKEGLRALFVNAPPNFLDELGSLPPGVTMSSQGESPLDFVLLFVHRRLELEATFTDLAKKLSPRGMIWVAWPKKASRVSTDLSFDVVQSVGLAGGLVDNKVCAGQSDPKQCKSSILSP